MRVNKLQDASTYLKHNGIGACSLTLWCPTLSPWPAPRLQLQEYPACASPTSAGVRMDCITPQWHSHVYSFQVWLQGNISLSHVLGEPVFYHVISINHF